MAIILLPLLLLLYAEFSKDSGTRATARLLLYGYAGSVMAYALMAPTASAIIVSGSLLLIGYALVFVKVRVLKTLPLLIILFLLTLGNTLSLVFNNFDIIASIPFYAQYSNIILRESTMIVVFLCNTKKGEDFEINCIAFILYISEYLYLLTT
jgi:hypothetical protein